MALSDFDKIMKQYENADDDFGFSAVSEEEYNDCELYESNDLKANLNYISNPNM